MTHCSPQHRPEREHRLIAVAGFEDALNDANRDVKKLESTQSNEQKEKTDAAQDGADQKRENLEALVKQKTDERLAKANDKLAVTRQRVDAVPQEVAALRQRNQKETELARRHNKNADDAANLVAGVVTAGAAPEAKTVTRERSSDVQVAANAQQMPAPDQAEKTTQIPDQPTVQTAQVDAAKAAEDANAIDAKLEKQKGPESMAA